MSTIALSLARGGASCATIKLPPDSVGIAQLKPHSVGSAQLKPHSLGVVQLNNGAVGTDQLKADSVEVFDYAPDSITSSAIAPGAITYQDFASGTVAPDLYAHVAADGTLGDNSGATRSARTGTGTYTVNFDRNVDGCVAVADVGTASSVERLGITPKVTAGAIAQASINAQGPTVNVAGYNGSGAPVDSEFNLVVLR
jgi:hypothetical protein